MLSNSTILYFDNEIKVASMMMKKDKDADVWDMLKNVLNQVDSESEGSRSRTESFHNDESGSEIHEDKGSE